MKGHSVHLDKSTVADDDSPFLSMADFFSLISLTVIYIVVAFTQNAAVTDSTFEPTTGVALGSGPASPLNPEAAYVSVLTDRGTLILRVLKPGGDLLEERSFASSNAGIQAATTWLMTQLSEAPTAKLVVVYMDATIDDPNAHKLFSGAVTEVRRQFRVFIAFADSGQSL